MSRYIDADALIDRLDYCVKEGMGSTIAFTFKHMVEEAPSIDIVRCKECKWCLVEEGGCERIGMVLFADEIENHFCGYGEREGE